MRLVWVTDTHLDSAPEWLRSRTLVPRIDSLEPDAVLITGDITTGKRIHRDLPWLARVLSGFPIYFVLGNHDYYGLGFSRVHEMVRATVSEHENLCWLSDEALVSLRSRSCLIGVKGWYSASFGDPSNMRFALDWRRIPELASVDDLERVRLYSDMAHDSAINVLSKLENAIVDHDTVYVATHFPPWREVAPEHPRLGRTIDDFWLSYHVNEPLGRAVEEFAAFHPEKRFIVLAGHTHLRKRALIRSNLECRVGRTLCWERFGDECVIDILTSACGTIIP